ncbi:MAG: 50S ribosome-binding GTPase [Planctomycetes bacterium]|nr:50S ribosome-binding GTPase [Planctomycetota bacterium]
MIPPPRASCLTPPSPGGIAVVQVIGDAAVPIVSRHLAKAGRPVELSQVPPDELRMCRVTDGAEVLDDAVVCVRQSRQAGAVIDINLHGGPRIVQRVLLMLQREGIRIVEPAELLPVSGFDAGPLCGEVMAAIGRAKTRQVALWLARLPGWLAAEIGRILECVRDDRISEAVAGLDQLLAAGESARILTEGARVVLRGRPNTGKSTLANALSEREHAIVSDSPGTTRDWTEHPAAVHGVPVTVVDTAGIREAADAIEQEAIRRAIQQAERAEVIVRVIDRSSPPHPEDQRPPLGARVERGRRAAILTVFNKCDLPEHPGRLDPGEQGRRDAICISALTGEGLDLLRTRIAESLGLPAGVPWPLAPFAPRQTELLGQARAALTGGLDDRTWAVACLQNLIGRDSPDGSSSGAGV